MTTSKKLEFSIKIHKHNKVIFFYVFDLGSNCLSNLKKSVKILPMHSNVESLHIKIVN